MNGMHEKGGVGIKTSGVAPNEQRIGGGNARKRPRRVPRTGNVPVSPTTIGRPNWKNRRSVDQKTPRTGIGTTIGGPNWKNGRSVDQKTPRTGGGATIGRPNWKNRRSVDQKTPRTGIGTSIGGPNWKNRQSVDQKTRRTGIGTTIGRPNWKNRGGVDQNVSPRACQSATGWEPAPIVSRLGVRNERGGRDGAHISPPMGPKTRKRAGWRPHFPSDGDGKHENVPLGAHFSPPTGTQNAKTRRLAPTHDTVRGSWVGRGPGGTWRQAWHVQPGVARPSSGASGVVSGACRATDGYRDICARAAQALGCGSAALSASGRATRRAGTVLAVAASWSNFPFRQRAGGALPEAIGSVLMWEGERSKRYGNKPKPGRLGRLGEVGSSRTKNTA